MSRNPYAPMLAPGRDEDGRLNGTWVLVGIGLGLVIYMALFLIACAIGLAIAPPTPVATTPVSTQPAQSATAPAATYPFPTISYRPRGSVDGEGLLDEVKSRCPLRERVMLAKDFPNNLPARCHEFTHFVGGHIECDRPDGVGRSAFYIGDGRAFYIVRPRVSRTQVISCVDPKYKNNYLYKWYFAVDRQSKFLEKTWQMSSLYALDEWTAAVNERQCSIELGVRDSSGNMFSEFCEYADATVRAVKKYDPNYPYLKELSAFVDWQKRRVDQLANAH